MSTDQNRPSIMPIEHVLDWEKRIARQDAFWQREILDRPPVWITVPRKVPVVNPPQRRHWATLRNRWLDTQWVVDNAVAQAMNTDWFGDSLPQTYPNLGPEVFSAFFGQELEFTEGSSWSAPILHDWNNAAKIRFSADNFYYRKLKELTAALLESGRGKFYTGLTDFHPGGDCLAAWRDPQDLAIDILERRDDIKKLLAYVDRVYYQVFDDFFNDLQSHRQAITTWLGFVSTRKWYVPSNDFSCMISKEMFDGLFLPGIAAECRHYEACIYHLDGPTALRHLDSLLAIPDLNAIQWVYGAGRGRATDWLHIYKKIQAAKKGFQIWVQPDELDTVIENLRPEGVWLGIQSVQDAEHAGHLINRVARWR